MKEKNLLPRYKISDYTVCLTADIVSRLTKLEEQTTDNEAARNQNIENLLKLAALGEISLPPLAERLQIWLQTADTLEIYARQSLQEAHRTLGADVYELAGEFRVSKGTASFPAKRLADFINLLLNWAEYGKKSPAHPLLQAAVVLYGIETVQPFVQGSRWMGLLWSWLILQRWQSGWKEIPLFAVLLEQQERYTEVLLAAQKDENAMQWIEFWLECALQAVQRYTPCCQTQVQPDNRSVQALLEVLADKTLSTREMMEGLHLKHRPTFRDHYLLPAIEGGLVKMTNPDKPNSCRQKYFRNPDAQGGKPDGTV